MLSYHNAAAGYTVLHNRPMYITILDVAIRLKLESKIGDGSKYSCRVIRCTPLIAYDAY